MLMRKILLALLVGVSVAGWGQNTFKAGTVNNQDFNNQYYKVTTFGPSNYSVVVDNPSTLNTGDRVLVLQMTGASYRSSDGTISNYNNAGNYEIAEICRKDGNIVYFTRDLLHPYNPVNGKVQLVKVQGYNSAVVNSKLEATPWDSSRGTGGVLAISVKETLILNGDISADNMGFAGGRFLMGTGNCTDFFIGTASGNYYNPNNTTSPLSGGYKGESIVNLDLAYRGGRGAVANGGGGGNNHNNGGGGGGNLTKGGIGGGNASTASDACQNDFPGKGGYGLNSDGNARIFFGGGGGSGHGNNTQQDGGGNGGGIIFLEAKSVVVNGAFKISANGEDGSNTNGDGASGGGAGGTIILNISTPSTVRVEANGGKGGDEDESDNDEGRCYGEGGGGSGGIVYIKGSQPTGVISVEGGVKGERKFTRCPLDDSALPGEKGRIIPIANYTESTSPEYGCPDPIVLPVKLLYFTVTNKGAQATAEWKVEKPEDAAHYVLQRKDNNGPWKDAHIIPGDAQFTTYQKGDGPLATGVYLYRLKIVEKDRSIHYSAVQPITIKNEDVNRLTIHPNPATSQVTIVTPSGHDEWLHIYDMESRLVYKKKIAPNDSVIRQDISFLAEGVYMIQVGKLTARFVVFK